MRHSGWVAEVEVTATRACYRDVSFEPQVLRTAFAGQRLFRRSHSIDSILQLLFLELGRELDRAGNNNHYIEPEEMAQAASLVRQLFDRARLEGLAGNAVLRLLGIKLGLIEGAIWRGTRHDDRALDKVTARFPRHSSEAHAVLADVVYELGRQECLRREPGDKGPYVERHDFEAGQRQVVDTFARDRRPAARALARVLGLVPPAV